MAAIAITNIDRNGAGYIDSLLTAASVGGDSLATTGQEYIVIKNASGGNITLTIAVQAVVDGQAVTNKTVTILAGKTYILGTFPVSTYGDASSLVQFTYSAVVSVTVAGLRYTGT